MGEKVSACLQFDIAIEEFWKFCVIFTIGKGMLLFFYICASVLFLFYRLVVQSIFFTKQIVF